jgi:hypothetical protein
MRAKKSATGSVKLMCDSFSTFSRPIYFGSKCKPHGENLQLTFQLPGRLCHARYFALQCQTAEAQPAHAELAHVRARAPTQLATAFLPGGKLRFLSCLSESCFCGHSSFSIPQVYCARNGIPRCLSSVRASLSLPAVVTMVTFMPFNLSTLA